MKMLSKFLCVILRSKLPLLSRAYSKNANPCQEPIVLVHGGAGDIPDSFDCAKYDGTKLAAQIGFEVLEKGGSSIDAVEEAVKCMELDEVFNSGYGSVLNYNGFIEMDASIMNGTDLNAGCVALIENILHPISLARCVMENSKHIFLGGSGAMEFAKEQKFEILDPPGQLVTEFACDALKRYKEDVATGRETFKEFGPTTKDGDGGGTVGAVAIDKYGNIAAGTSTGGITGKMPGRIGDSPVLGVGTYADNLVGGVSITGYGESILRYGLALKILNRMQYCDVDVMTATVQALEDMTAKLNQGAGAIVIDSKGNLGIYFTSQKMAWACRKPNEIRYGIRLGEVIIENPY